MSLELKKVCFSRPTCHPSSSVDFAWDFSCFSLKLKSISLILCKSFVALLLTFTIFHCLVHGMCTKLRCETSVMVVMNICTVIKLFFIHI